MNLSLAFSNKSDNLIFMKEMSATEVSRNFAAVIADVEAGLEVAIIRGGRQVARMLPPVEAEPNGAALLKALTEWQAKNPPIDDDGAWDSYYESKEDPINQVRDPWEE
jgi:antitoxin (DNA-binding transcriptional repressor) of toxin-antitoxin stability system